MATRNSRHIGIVVFCFVRPDASVLSLGCLWSTLLKFRPWKRHHKIIQSNMVIVFLEMPVNPGVASHQDILLSLYCVCNHLPYQCWMYFVCGSVGERNFACRRVILRACQRTCDSWSKSRLVMGSAITEPYKVMINRGRFASDLKHIDPLDMISTSVNLFACT